MAEARRWPWKTVSFKTMKSRVTIALVAWLGLLVVVGSYAVSLTVVGGLELRAVRTLSDKLYTPTEALVSALQHERRASMEYIGSRAAGRDTLDDQRKLAMQAELDFRRLAGSDDVLDSGSDALRARIAATVTGLAELDSARRSIDAGSADQQAAAGVFTDVITRAFGIYYAMPVNQEADVSDVFRSIVTLQRAREAMAQETAVLSGALANGRMTPAQHESFGQLVGAQRFLLDDAPSGLDDEQRKNFDELIQSTTFTELRATEDKVTGLAPEQTQIPVSASVWSTTEENTLAELRALEASFLADMLKQSDSAANAIILRTAIVVLAGLVLVIFFMTVWLRVAPRHVISQLTGLKDAALQLANERLPRVVDQLRRGKDVDVQAEAPPLEFGPDEFGDVGRAFNVVQQTAVQAAIDQAALRNGIKDVFVNLARRSQGLVQRQLSLLEAMERRTSDPEELEQLFVIDHLATRMRRHAEDLIILSGSQPGRQWRRPVPMVDVVRGAVGEVENYARVTILPIQPAALAGRVVADVIHLLAELVENAASFSPPHTTVRVSGEWVSSGFVVEIEDSGLGITEEDLARYNDQLQNPPEFDLSDSQQLGLLVVGRLAERHGIKVHLRRSPYGGITAIALIPEPLVVTAQDGNEPDRARIPAATPPSAPQPAGTRVSGPLGAENRRGPAPDEPAVEAVAGGLSDTTAPSEPGSPALPGPRHAHH